MSKKISPLWIIKSHSNFLYPFFQFNISAAVSKFHLGFSLVTGLFFFLICQMWRFSKKNGVKHTKKHRGANMEVYHSHVENSYVSRCAPSNLASAAANPPRYTFSMLGLEILDLRWGSGRLRRGWVYIPLDTHVRRCLSTPNPLSDLVYMSFSWWWSSFTRSPHTTF